jgi:hypothetical protein
VIFAFLSLFYYKLHVNCGPISFQQLKENRFNNFPRKFKKHLGEEEEEGGE